MELILERLGESDTFWNLIAGHAALISPSDHDYPGETFIDGQDLIADLGVEIGRVEELIHEEELGDGGEAMEGEYYERLAREDEGA